MDDLRIEGETRYETAVEVSKSGWESSETVVLATALNFPDALAGGPLAYKEDAPILLTAENKLIESTKEEILRLGAEKVIILGETAAISDNVKNDLKNMGIKDIERIGGDTRYETAALIAEKIGETDHVFIANAFDFPDALAISPYAASEGYPILLTPDSQLPEATSAYIENNTIEKSYVIGGTEVISDNVLASLPSGKRVAGDDRFETNTEIIKTFQDDATTSYLTTGLEFADALTGAVLAAKEDAAILLTIPDKVPTSISELLESDRFLEAIPIGGDKALEDSVASEANDLIENNLFEKAFPIRTDKEYSSYFQRSNYYQVEMKEPGQLTVGMHQHLKVGWDINLYNEKEQWMDSYKVKTGDEEEEFHIGLKPGTYYIKIENSGYYTASYVRYKFYTTFDSEGLYEQEPNDVPGDATEILMNDQMYTGHMSDTNDQDYYTFSLDESGKVEISMKRQLKGEWALTLYDKDENKIGYFDADQGTGYQELVAGLKPGKYYVMVEPQSLFDDETVHEPYHFSVNYTNGSHYEKELNDDFASATPVNIGEKYTGFLQRTASSQDAEVADYYEFTLQEGQKIDLSLEKYDDKKWRYEIYKSDNLRKSIIDAEVDKDTKKHSNNIELDPGTYFMVIEHTGLQPYFDENVFYAEYDIKIGE